MLDVVVRPTASIAPTSDTPAAIRVSRGGSGANLAVALRSSDHDVLYVGAGGGDAACELFVEALRRAGVQSRLELFDDVPTGTVVALIDAKGERSMLSDRGANSRLHEAFVAQQLAEPFDHLHVSGYVLLDAATRGVAVSALALAHGRGSSTSIDVCSVAPLRAVTPEVFLASASGATMIFANEEEALTLSSENDVEGALDFLGTLFDEVVITVGARGAYVARGLERLHSGASTRGVVDTTGAGDAATGTYLGARLSGDEPYEALLDAMLAAAQVVGGLGALG
jgi:sugar/nucleoside kinase (ribokinase family)